MARSVQIFRLGQDVESEVAYLLPKEPHIDRVVLAKATRADYNIPSGTRQVIFQYAGCTADVFVRVKTDSDLTTPSGAVSDGEAPFVNPTGLSGLEAGDLIQFISASSGAVHIICVG